MIMDEHSQVAVFLKLRSEYQEVCRELTALRELLRQISDRYKARSESLRKAPDTLFLDKSTEVLEAENLCETLNRYRNLLAEKADKKYRLEPFGELFPPLE